MDWFCVKDDFEPDGGLRDIYVFATDSDDWQRVLDAVQEWDPNTRVLIDDELIEKPWSAKKLLNERSEHSILWIVNLGEGVRAHSHFFSSDEIEFDIDPREFTGPSQLQGLEDFMALLGEVTASPVVLTPENLRDCPILTYSPQAKRMEWVPARHRR